MSIGIFNTGIFSQNQAKLSFETSITRLMPNGTAPLVALSGYFTSEVAVQPEHFFFTKTMLFPSFTLSASALATDTVLNVTSVSNLVPNSMFQVPTTQENIMILSVISGTQISVARGVGSVSAQAISSGVAAYSAGNAFEEGSLRPPALNINPVRISNYTQIFRNTWALTGTAAATVAAAGDSNVSESRQDCARFHATDIEKQLIFGQKSLGSKNGQPIRTMDGLISVVGNLAYYPSSYSAPNVFTAGSTTNYTQLENYLNPTLNQVTDPAVGNKRLLFVGSQSAVVINNIGRLNSQYMVQSGQTDWGLQFGVFKTSRGEFTVIEHPLLNSNPIWSKMALVVDVSSIRMAWLNGRKTSLMEFNTDGNATDNGIDAVGGTYTSELTMLVKNPPANAVITNLTAAAAG
jgi:Family of unknown function (DUF5309)